jgi:hypothetical protein
MTRRETDDGFVHVVGYGLSIVTPPGTELSQAEAQPDTIILRHPDRAEPAVLSAAVLHRRLSEGAAVRIDDRVEVLICPSSSGWTLRTADYQCIWPRGLDVQARGGKGHPSAFDLVGAGGALVWIQGPIDRRAVPADEAFAAAGQRLEASGRTGRSRWVELRWEEDGKKWVQRHYVMPHIARTALVVSLEAPAPPDRVITAAEEVLRSLELHGVAPE